MKIKQKSSRKNGQSLIIETTAEEELAYAEAECVKRGCDETLLTFSYGKKGKGYKFVYYLGTAEPVLEYLSRPISEEYFRSILVSFLRLFQACESNGLSSQRISFRPEHVFFDPAHYALKFIYCPVRQTKEQLSEPTKVLAQIAEKVVVENGQGAEVAAKALDYARRSAIFSWVDYERFLRSAGVIEGKREEPAAEWSGGKRNTSRIDVRDSFGFDFAEVGKAAKPAAAVSSSAARAGKVYALMRVDDGSTWRLTEGEMVVGSSPECDLQLPNVLGLSRKHAVIRCSRGQCDVKDLGSTNGTTVYGRRLQPDVYVGIGYGEVIEFAKTRFKLTEVE